MLNEMNLVSVELDRLAALNTDCARTGGRPETCDGCTHYRYACGGMAVGAISACTLFGRPMDSKPRPLIRTCYTWED